MILHYWKSALAGAFVIGLAAGKDNKGIANTLSISLKTAEFHVTSILKKLDLHSRDEAIVGMLKH